MTNMAAVGADAFFIVKDSDDLHFVTETFRKSDGSDGQSNAFLKGASIEGRPSRFIKPPGNFPAAYIFLRS